MRTRSLSPLVGCVGLAVAASVGSAATIVPGIYTLHNHPDGNVNPPPYGAKFTKLYDAAGDPNDHFTMDFDHPMSSMTLTYNDAANTIVIAGQAWGGRDVGAVHAADQYLGLYTFNFVYNLGVADVPGDDDIWVNTNTHVNLGTIMTPLGDTINLVDEHLAAEGHSFRFGDENNDLGHRGHSGISGWGWMSYDRGGAIGIQHFIDTDWLFTAQFLIPAPGASVLALAGGLLMMRRRRQA